MGSVEAPRIAALVAQAGLGDMHAVTPLLGGANNRVFRVETTHRTALLKVYFRHPDDPRDRLGTEFAFSRFAWNHGIRALPEPLACDADAGIGLFEFLEAHPLKPDEVDQAALDAALSFVRDLNLHRFVAEAALLPRASEACFSIQDHLSLIRQRVERLSDLPVHSVVDMAARTFVEHELLPTWHSILDRVKQEVASTRVDICEPLPTRERCLSPSDFGYHNALRERTGRLRFVDFEYAGWDDPAKLICDFFCQPAIPAPIEAFPRFCKEVSLLLPTPTLHTARAELLFPLYRLKWCCIVLNDFLRTASQRRRFSLASHDQEERKIRQLAKARVFLATVSRSYSTTRQVA